MTARASPENRTKPNTVYGLIISFLCTAAYMVALCMWFAPVWETNDDVAMAMVAHGYGFASQSSPNLLFSNVMWGHFVQGVHGLFGMQGYSVGTLGVLLLAGWSILYFLVRLGVGYIVGLSAVATIVSWPILFPQFTMNAGLATVAAVLGGHVYSQTRDLFSLAIACVLAVIGFLVRSLEFALILLVAAPLLPWSRLFKDRLLLSGCAAVLAIIVTAQAADSITYHSSDWEAFHTHNVARAPYTDFGLGSRIKERPDILEKYERSTNDIDLISAWFFEDRALSNASVMNEMAKALGPKLGQISASSIDFAGGFDGLKKFYSPRAVAMTALAFTLLLLLQRRSLMTSWVIAIGLAYGMGLVGASVHDRVLFPMVALLAIMAVAHLAPTRTPILRVTASVVTLAAFACTAQLLFPLATASSTRIATAQAAFASIDKSMLYVWGGSLDFEATYPVRFSPYDSKLQLPLYALGVMTRAPFSVAHQEVRQGRGLIKQLQTPEGIDILISSPILPLLAKYCEEHLGSTLRISNLQKAIGLRRLNCAKTALTE